MTIAVHIALDNGLGAQVKLAQFSGGTVEWVRPDEMESIIARVGRVGIDAGKVDPVIALSEALSCRAARRS